MKLFSKYLNRFLLLVSIFAMENGYAAGEFTPQPLFIDKNYKEIKLTDQNNVNSVIGSICAVTSFTENSVLVANYLQIIQINLDTGKTKVWEKPLGIDKWYPTGLKWHKATQTLYVANYLGKDVLALKFNNNKLILERRITDNELDGPENLDISDDGNLIAVADFNSSKLIVFEKNGKKLWSSDIGRAHGVAFSADQKSIFVSGLIPPKVYKFSVNGKLISEIGKSGFGKDGFLWPTGLTKRGKYIYVSDAHTGKVTQLDNNLRSMKTWGGNGLGKNLFNMPYGPDFIKDNVLMLTDTFKARLVFVDLKKNSIMLSYNGSFSPVSLQGNEILSPVSLKQLGREEFYYQDQPFDKIEPLGLHYNERLDTTSSFMIPMVSSQKELFNGKWKRSYNSIISEQGAKLLHFLGAHYYFSSSIYYWILADNFKIDNKQYLIIGSPETSEWIIGRDGVFLPVHIGFDYWLYKGSLCSSEGKCIKYENIAKLAEEKINKIKTLELTYTDPLSVIESAYRLAGEDIEKMFSSVGGKELLKQVRAESNISKINSLSLNFLKKLDKESFAYFPELIFASTLFAITQNPKDASN